MTTGHGSLDTRSFVSGESPNGDSGVESVATLGSLLKHSMDLIYFKDRESRFVRYSEAMAQYLGAANGNGLKGKTDFDFFPEGHARVAFEDEQEILRTGKPIIKKLEKVEHPDGRVSWFVTTKMPWCNERGEIIGTCGVSHDITAIKLAETELAYERDLLRALLDASPDQIYFKDLQSRFLRVSRAQARNFGVDSPDELVGKSDFDYFTEAHARPAFEDEQGIMRSGTPLIGKVEKETWADGRLSWALTSKMPYRNQSGEIIGTLGISKNITELKETEARLEQAQKKLLEASREAGMAEVATSVLHNVGNVLNSVNVSTSLVADQLRASKVAALARVAEMLRSQSENLAEFLTRDPKGRKIPEYVAALSQQLIDEQTAILSEIEGLRKNVDHIKEIVAMQQNYAKVRGVSEKVELVEVVEDALKINEAALQRHGVEVVREYPSRPVVTTERHKVIQILVNLLQNAKNACTEAGRAPRRIVVRIAEENSRVMIAVTDNGVGISPENLTRIFGHGFTTRKDGHGFGLHSGSLIARELNGSLTARSDGLGHGATFVLEFPGTPCLG